MLIVLKKTQTQINKTQTPALPPPPYPEQHHKFLMLTSGVDLNFLLSWVFVLFCFSVVFFFFSGGEGGLIQNAVLPLVYCSSALTCRLYILCHEGHGLTYIALASGITVRSHSPWLGAACSTVPLMMLTHDLQRCSEGTAAGEATSSSQ